MSSVLYVAACPDLTPRISRAGCSNHCLDIYITGFRSASRHKSMIVRVSCIVQPFYGIR